MGISDHLLRNLYAGQEASWEICMQVKKQQLELDMEQQTGSKWGKDYVKAFDCVDHNKRWKILREMGIPDHLTCLLRKLYAGQEASVRLDMEQ